MPGTTSCSNDTRAPRASLRSPDGAVSRVWALAVSNRAALARRGRARCRSSRLSREKAPNSIHHCRKSLTFSRHQTKLNCTVTHSRTERCAGMNRALYLHAMLNGTCPLGPRVNTLPESHGASNKLSSVEAELDHDGDVVARQVAAPGSTGPLGGELAPLLRELVDTGAWPCGQLAQHKLAPRRNSGKLLLVPD